MRALTIVVLALGVLVCSAADARCVCRCVNGAMRAVCSNPDENAPACPLTSCPATGDTDSRPLVPAKVPPEGATQCGFRNVWDPEKHRFQWKDVCW